MQDLSKLKDLVRLMVENDLSEIDLKDADTTITIRRGPNGGTVINHQPVIYGSAGGGGGVPAAAMAMAPADHAPPATNSAAAAPAGKAADDRAGLQAILSPMVGTFYASANPDSPPFVQSDKSVNPNTTVCLIEAMKVFNEIKAEMDGVVHRVLVKNGDAVEFGQELFLIRPS